MWQELEVITIVIKKKIFNSRAILSGVCLTLLCVLKSEAGAQLETSQHNGPSILPHQFDTQQTVDLAHCFVLRQCHLHGKSLAQSGEAVLCFTSTTIIEFND